jgi:hypothetical protein
VELGKSDTSLCAEDWEDWKDALAQLDRLGIPNGDRGEEAKGRTPGGSQGTYMDDSAGYIIQYITEGMQ